MLTGEPGTSLLAALDVQRNVLGALLMRELHTRYGRDNIGYLWMLAEPMLLAAAVAAIHVGSEGVGGHHGTDIRVVPFALTGYCVFIIFRSIVSRAEATLESNKALLFHRMVTIFDMLLARALLEFFSTLGAFVILIAGAIAFDLADPPARPLMLLGATVLLTWLSFALSMLICAATHFSHAIAKIIHPTVYILMPLSGAFFIVDWIPQPYQSWIAWSPIVQIFEMVHMGQFASVEDAHFNLGYIIAWCMGLTLAGLLYLRILRRHVHLS